MDHKNLTVAHSNALTEARYSLTPAEQKIMFLLISNISKDDKDFKDYEIRVSDFAQIMEINSKNIYGRLKETLEKLSSRTLFVPRKTGFLLIGWISSAEYIEGKGIIQLSFDKKLKPYLLQLKGKFTQYGLFIAAQFKSFYTIRIYMLLKQYENIGKREFNIYELRDLLDIKKNEYKRFADFRIRVLNQAKKEFDKKDKETGLYLSDINFNLETIREGRKISRLRFIIIKQKTKEMITLIGGDNSESEDEAENSKKEKPKNKNLNPTLEKFKDTPTFKALKLLGINEKKRIELFEEYGEETIKEKLEVLAETQEIKEIKTPSGFLLKALKEDYQSKKTIEKQKEEENQKRRQEEARKQKQKRRKEQLEKDFEREQRKTIEDSIKNLPEIIMNNLISQYEETESFKKGMEMESVADSYKQNGIHTGWGRASFNVFIKDNLLPEKYKTFENWLKFKNITL